MIENGSIFKNYKIYSKNKDLIPPPSSFSNHKKLRGYVKIKFSYRNRFTGTTKEKIKVVKITIPKNSNINVTIYDLILSNNSTKRWFYTDNVIVKNKNKFIYELESYKILGNDIQGYLLPHYEKFYVVFFDKEIANYAL